MALEKITLQQLKEDPECQLKKFRRSKDFLVAIDTDGCVTDNMNGKQMLIFHPQYMEFYSLWDIESYFREVAEYYNLFSVHRGCNRFIAVSLTLKALHTREDAKKAARERAVTIPDQQLVDDYINWCAEKKLGLGNPSLEQFLATRPLDFQIYKLLGWSEAVNRTFPFVNVKIPPFQGVHKALQMMAEHADLLVVSQTPYEDLVNYWEAQNLAQYISIIAGQEMGSKAHHIELVKKSAGYKDTCVLMLGDGDGDLKAVKKNNGLFYPIPPGKENEAWKMLPERFESFLNGTYARGLEPQLLDEFARTLLTAPPWEMPGYNHIEAYREKQEIRKSLYKQLNPDGRLLIL